MQLLNSSGSTPLFARAASLAKDANRLNKIIRKASAYFELSLEILKTVMERRLQTKLLAIVSNSAHPLHKTIDAQWSMLCIKLLLQQREISQVCPSILWLNIRMLYPFTEKRVHSRFVIYFTSATGLSKVF